MKIKEEVKIGVAVPLIFFLIFAVLSYGYAKWIERKFTQVTEVEAPKSEAASRMEVGLIGIGFELMTYMQSHSPASLELIKDYDKDFRKCLSIYCRLAEKTESEPLAAAADKDYAVLKRTVEELINLEHYQVKKLTMLHNSFKEADRILSEEFMVDIKADEQYAYEKLKAVVQMQDGINEIKLNLHHYLIRDEPQYYESNIYKHQQDIERFTGAYKKLESVPKQAQQLGRLSNIYTKSMRLVRDVIALEKKKKDNLEEYKKARDNLRLVLGNNVEKVGTNLEQAKESGYKAISIYIIAAPIVVFVGLIVTLISQAYASYLITLPVTELKDAAAKISQGKYDTKIYVEPDDEFGQLAGSICKIAEELKEARMDEHEEKIAHPEKAGASPPS